LRGGIPNTVTDEPVTCRFVKSIGPAEVEKSNIERMNDESIEQLLQVERDFQQATVEHAS
jgi:hypothetical protein